MTSPTSDRRQGLVGNTPIKAPVDLATTANITLSGEQSIDGVMTSSSRVLVKNQTDATQNGLYDSSSAGWTRCADADGTYDLTTGSLVYVAGGSNNGGSFFQVSTPKPLTIGSSIITWIKGLFGSSSALSFVQAGLGAIARSVQDKGRDDVGTKDFGAVHDGVTDDTNFVQAALTFGQLTGLEVEVYPGTAIVTALSVTGSVRMRGKGPASLLKQKAGTNNNLVTITGSGTTVDIDGIYFDGQQASQGALSTNDVINSTATGVANGKPFYLTVTNCEFLNTPYRSVAVYGANDATKRQVARVTGCRFRNGSVNAVNTTYSPIDIHLVNGVEAVIDDNDFTFDSAPTLPGGRGGVIVAQTQTVTPYYTRATITNNRFNYRGVNELASLGAVDCYIWSGNATVADNVFVNSTAAAIKFKGNSYNFSAINNKIDGYYSTGGALANFAAISFNSPNYGTSASQFVIHGNQITNWNPGSGTGFISVQAYDGANFSKNVSVLNNQISVAAAAAGSVGIDINNCQDVTVAGNEIDGRGNVSLGIRVLACDGSIRITGNKVSGTSSYSIYNDTPLTATQDVFIADNTILGNSGTYSIYTHCRQANVRQNWISGGVHGVNFGGGVQSAICDGNTLTNMSGTVGFNVTSTVVNLLARGNSILDSTGIGANAFVVSSTPTGVLINTNNTWNGQVTQGSAAPVTGAWSVGDYCRNTAPTAVTQLGWVVTSTTAGSSGVWTPVVLP